MLAIEEIEIALGPAFVGDQQDPPRVRGRRDAEDVLFGSALAEDQLVLRRVVAESMEANPPVIVLVPGGDRSGRGVDGVIEAALDPRDRASLGVREPIRARPPRRRLYGVG